MFIPHGHCYLWKPALVGLHLTSDLLIAIAYYSIPITLIYFVRQRRDLPFGWILWLFSAFIVACGTTHILAVWTLWHPTYWISGWAKAITAVVSLSTAIALVPLVPNLLALPSPTLLTATNRELQQEIAARIKSEARYRAIVQDQTELIARFQPDGTLLFVNDAYCRYFDIERKDIIGKQYQPVVFPGDREKVAELVSTLNADNPVVVIENRVIVNDEIRWTQWINRALFDQETQFIEFQSAGRDITEQKQAQLALQESQRFIQKIADTAPIILYVYDLSSHQIVYNNRNLIDVLGYTSEDRQSLAITLFTMMHSDDLAQLTERQRHWVNAKEGEILQTEYRLKHASGEWRYFQCQETLFACDENNLPQQILGVAVDITDRKQTQQLQASLREKEVLLKEIHHRVKNNLQIVYSMLRLQSRQMQDSPFASMLLESQSRIKSIALVHEKLYRSVDLSQIDFAQYIDSLVAYLFSSYKPDSSRITLETQVDPILLSIDQAVPCGLIINELVSNALKYAFPGRREGTIQVLLHRDPSSHPQPQVILIVKDNGVGLPKSLDWMNTTSLGLQLVQDFVAQLKGTLNVEHHPGTTFTITFPGSHA
jgi:PAS domain S-box-containing protein